MQTQTIIDEYQNGAGTNELAQKYSMHRSTIQRILKRNNILLRKRTPTHKYDVNFFAEYNRDSCYWAGFILADGCIRSDRDSVSIKLSSVDDTHLLKFTRCINYTGKVHYSHDGSYCYVDVCGKWFKHDLKQQFGILPCKTKTTKIYDQIPLTYYPDFIRGIIDGDGSITYYRSANDKKPTLRILGTEMLLKQISEYFRTRNVTMRTKTEMPAIVKCAGVYSICYSMNNTYKILTDIIYKHHPNCIYLSRKFNTWKSLRR